MIFSSFICMYVCVYKGVKLSVCYAYKIYVCACIILSGGDADLSYLDTT